MAHLELRLQRYYGLTRQQAREVIQSCTKRRMRRSPWLIGLAVAMLAALLVAWWSHTWAPMRLFAPVMLPMVIAIQHAGAKAAEPEILAEAARLQRDSRRLDEDFATLQQAMKTRAHADPSH